MHRILTTPGGWTPESEGVLLVEQDPAPLVIGTAADTDIQLLAAAQKTLPAGFAAMRVVNLLHLQQHFSIDDYADTVLAQAQGILLRILGGRAYWSYGLEVVQPLAQRRQIPLIVLPGDDRPDWDLLSHSTVELAQVHELWRYWLEGGIHNIAQSLRRFSDLALGTDWGWDPLQSWPRVGAYAPPVLADPAWPGVGILVYRAHVVAGNTAPVDALCHALVTRQLRPVVIYTYGIREPDLATVIQDRWQAQVDVVINTTSFALSGDSIASDSIASNGRSGETHQATLWDQLDVPVLQAILSGGSQEQWQGSTRGLGSRDIAMNVALPEMDGHLITRAISFKTVQGRDPDLQTEVVGYQAVPDRVAFVAELAQRWIRLRRTPNPEKRVALILANYPCRDGRLANGVGLDTPASCVGILAAMQQAGYTLLPQEGGEPQIPGQAQELIDQLTQGVTNDPMGRNRRQVRQMLAPEAYQSFWQRLPAPVQTLVRQQWGDPPTQAIPIAGIQWGNVFVGIQPARGYDEDPSLGYHAPDLVPPHAYLAFYAWIRQVFEADAIVHVGKHGNLEWLPGKGIGLSSQCFPEVVLGPMPHLYPFIVNDPGEGSQAKRRSQAVIIDHLTPPLTRAELYGPLAELETLLDEHSQAQALDPPRLPLIEARLRELIQQTEMPSRSPSQKPEAWDQTLADLDGYLCELKEAQIRDGLHILGQVPEREQLIGLLAALARYPGGSQQGLTQAIAQDWGLPFDPLQAELADPYPPEWISPI